MAIPIQHKQASVGRAGEGVPGAVPGDGGQPMAARLSIFEMCPSSSTSSDTATPWC